MNDLKRTANVLDNFRNYSYQFAVVLCDTTATANSLSTQKNLNLFSHPSGQEKYTLQTIKNNSIQTSSNKGAQTISDVGNYVVLINTTTDSEFVVNSLKYTNIFMNDSVVNGVSFAHTMSFEATMEITEPLGVKFYNILANATRLLKTNLVGCIWLIKPIFIGHTHDGYTETISNLKPIYLIPNDVISQIDEVGTVYKFSFVGASNGFGKSAQIGNLVDGISLGLAAQDKQANPGPMTVTEGLKKLQVHINNQYDVFSEKIHKDLVENVKDSNSVKFDPTSYKPVKYVIELGENSYQSSSYKLGTDANNESTETGNNDVIKTWGYKGASVENVIRMILESSAEIKAEATVAEDKKRYIPKIVSEVISTNDEYVVKYTVNRYEIVGYTAADIQNGTEPSIEDSQTLMLNYIFTGRNLDILEFDINMEFGMSFMMTMASMPNIPQKSNDLESSKSLVIGSTPRQTSSKYRKQDDSSANIKTPLFLGNVANSFELRNMKNPVENATYRSLMQRHAAYETLETKVKIRGNPALLTPAIKDPPPQLDVNGNVPFADNFDTTPGYAKIKVFYPEEPGTQGSKYSQFWYDGYYIIFSVEHVFAGGEFTQEIEMVGMPVFEDITPSTKESRHENSGDKAIPNTNRNTNINQSSTKATRYNRRQQNKQRLKQEQSTTALERARKLNAKATPSTRRSRRKRGNNT